MINAIKILAVIVHTLDKEHVWQYEPNLSKYFQLNAYYYVLTAKLVSTNSKILLREIFLILSEVKYFEP